jgi:hypothetical protein
MDNRFWKSDARVVAELLTETLIPFDRIEFSDLHLLAYGNSAAIADLSCYKSEQIQFNAARVHTETSLLLHICVTRINGSIFKRFANYNFSNCGGIRVAI